MDTVVRALVVLALLGLSVFRLIRYFRYGVARRVTAGTPSTLGLMPAPEASTAQSSDVPGAASSRLARVLAGATTVLVFFAANSVLCLVLFGLPALGQILLIWRLFVVIFANFYLLPFAQAVGKKQLKRLQARAGDTPNPIGS
jgi:hypothetical protein